MPEGPEVQTIADGLRALITGKTFSAVAFFGDAVRMVDQSDATALEAMIAGQPVIDVGRRGKFIDIALGNGLHLLIHLMMTGRVVFTDATHPLEPPRFLRCSFTFTDGAALHLGDQRKWARLLCLTDEQLATEQAATGGRSRLLDLGVDALGDEFTYPRFRALLTSRRNLHTFLLDQKKLSGLGNIYVNEALFHAGLHPLRAANSLSETEAMALYYAIRHVLREAVRQLGTSFSHYWRPDGTPGAFQNFLHVFRRAGEPCLRCGTPIVRNGLGGRGAFFCPNGQSYGGDPPPPGSEFGPGAPLPNHILILAGSDTPANRARAAQIAAHVPYTQSLPQADAALIEYTLRAGRDALLLLPDEEAAALQARYRNVHRIAPEGETNEAMLHAAFDAIYAIRCQNPIAS